jgi:hypothetical protein
MVSVFFEHNNFDLLSYALGAEDNKTALQGRVPQREGKDKQHTHKNCLYGTQYSDDVYLKIAPVFCIYCKWARGCVIQLSQYLPMTPFEMTVNKCGQLPKLYSSFNVWNRVEL